MNEHNVRYIHKIAPRASDVGPKVRLSKKDLESRCTLGKALREAGIIGFGESLQDFRVEENTGMIIAFPRRSIWHSIIISPMSDD